MESVKKEDIPSILETLLQEGELKEGENNVENFKDFAFFIMIGIDLGVDSEKIKILKDDVYNGKVTAEEGLEQIFKYWIEIKGSGATWNGLISSFTLTTLQFPGLASKDYVTLLKQKSPVKGIESVDTALQVNLTRDEIYKYLSFRDKANLRLVNRKMWRLTLPSWRKTVVVRICLVEDPGGTLLLKDFVNLLTQGEDGKWTEDIYKLLEFPFENVKLDWSANQSPDSYRSWDFFWDFYARNIVRLQVKTFEGDLLGLFRRITLSTCPKLAELSFLNCKDEGNCNEGDWGKGKAEHLTSFVFITALRDANGFGVHGQPEGFQKSKLLEIAPNLKSLETDDFELLDGLLLHPNEPRKLQKLIFSSPFDCAYVKNYAALRRYTEKYSTTKNLTLNKIRLYTGAPQLNARAAPFDFYCAIKNCAPTLTNLRLNFSNFDGDHPWIFDLATITFPVLLKFEVNFSVVPRNYSRVKYDFGSLKNMPKLKSLSIIYKDPMWVQSWERNEEKWFYHGPVNQFIPEGTVVQVNLNPLCLEHLENFDFYGWHLEENDFKLFREWFPNLKRFRGRLDGYGLGKVLKALPSSVNSITLMNKGRYRRDPLCEAKLDFEKVRIFKKTLLGYFEVIKEGHVAFLKDNETPYAKMN